MDTTKTKRPEKINNTIENNFFSFLNLLNSINKNKYITKIDICP